MKADEPAMSFRTALCGVLQNEQRYPRLLKKSNDERSRLIHMTRSLRKGIVLSQTPPELPGGVRE